MRVQELFDLSGKVAIVTGGGSGIGRQMAGALVEAGASLMICSRRLDRCEEGAAELAALGGRALAMACDVRRPDEVRAVVERTRRELGSVDILVNNAGTSWGAPAVEHSLEGWQKVVDVNLTGLFLFAQSAGRVMIEQGGGRIVNIASIAAFVGMPPEYLDAVAYSASKGAVVALTRDLAVKWARHGVNVNAIAPGWFPSELSSPLLERNRDLHVAGIPLGRLGGPDDLKGAVVLLASAAGDFITGQTLIVDGGLAAG